MVLATLRMALYPSPDGRHLAHTDKEGRLYLTDLQAKGAAATRLIDHSLVGGGYPSLSWSPDGRAIAFTRASTGPWREQLFLYTLADGKLAQLSSDRYDNEAPAFTPDGKWLYFLSRRHFRRHRQSRALGRPQYGPLL